MISRRGLPTRLLMLTRVLSCVAANESVIELATPPARPQRGLTRGAGRGGDAGRRRVGLLTQELDHPVRLRFGLTDGQPRTLDEIGQVYGVTRVRIRQCGWSWP